MKEVKPVELALENLRDYREGYQWFCNEDHGSREEVLLELGRMCRGNDHTRHIIGKLASFTFGRFLLDKQKEGKS